MTYNPTTGVYTPPAGATNAVPGELIQSAVWNTIHVDFAGAFNQLTADAIPFQTVAVGTIGSYLPTEPAVARLVSYNPSLDSVGTTVPGSANEVNVAVYNIIPATSSTASYEKVGIFSWLFHEDPSVYGTTTVTRDGVSADIRAELTNNNTTGRIWAAYFQAFGDPGSDGQIVGIEVEVDNEGTVETDPLSTLAKTNILLSMGGSVGHGTSAIFLDAGAPSTAVWEYGVYVRTSSIAPTGHLISYPNVFDVNAKGNLTTKTMATSTPVAVTATYTVAVTDSAVIVSATGTVPLTLPSAGVYPGRILQVKTVANQAVISATANVVPLTATATTTAIVTATAGRWATLQSDNTNWVVMAGN